MMNCINKSKTFKDKEAIARGLASKSSSACAARLTPQVQQ